MTTNAINWFKSLEERRHNLETEKIQKSANAQKRRELSETIRHNRAGESLGVSTLSETSRSNLANEDIKYYSAREIERNNRAMEIINQVRNRETERTNRANEVIKQVTNAENERHARASEVLEDRRINEMERTDRANEVINQERNVETNRHSTAQENFWSHDLQVRGDIARLSANASMFAATTAASASRYGAYLNNEASHYATDVADATKRALGYLQHNDKARELDQEDTKITMQADQFYKDYLLRRKQTEAQSRNARTKEKEVNYKTGVELLKLGKDAIATSAKFGIGLLK